MRFFDFHLSPKNLFADIIREHHPDAIVCTDVLNENDVSLMQDARRRRIPVLGMVRSWDNLTVLGLMRILPDYLLVTTGHLKHEAETLNGMNPGRITVVGVPHYDGYRMGAKMSREEFFKKIGADPNKKLIFYTPIGDLYIKKNDTDRYVLDLLAGLDDNVIVRFPPNDTVSYLDDFKKPERMYFDRPGVQFSSGEIGHRDVSKGDDQMLENGLYHADLVITGPSTIAVDAALFDKPIILINIQPGPPRSYFDSIYSYDYVHVGYVLATGGAHMAKTRNELATWIQSYLKDPAIDHEGRERLRKEQCGTNAGASERVANAVLQFLQTF